MSEREALAADLRRVADRLRTAPVARVEHAAPRVRELLQTLADAAAGIESRDAAAPPRWRAVPTLPEIALGDQLDVLGSDLLAALRGVEPDAEVWVPTGRATVSTLLEPFAETLKAVRAAL